jgi:hypothetical protein
LPSVGHIRSLGKNWHRMWGVAFSPSGEQLAFSGPSADGSQEVLRVIRSADIGHAPAADLLAGAAHWRMSSDGRRIYYLADYNYADRSAGPGGTLTMIDFPGGTDAQPLQPAVASFLALGAPGQPDQGIAFLQDVSDGTGTLRMLRDRAHPADVTTVDTKVADFEISSNLAYSYVFKLGGDGGPESLVARNDGKGSCPLGTYPGGLPYLITFVGAARMVLFIENDANNEAQGFYTDPEGCQDKRHFASNMAFLAALPSSVVYGEQDRSGRLMTLRHAPVNDGFLPVDGGTLLEPAIDTQVAIAGERYIVYTITQAADETRGLYVYGPLL